MRQKKNYNTVGWQKKKYQVLERDNYTCKYCFDNGSAPLEVHHLAYNYDGDLIDVPIEKLITICHDCHEEQTALRKDSKPRTRLLDEIRCHFQSEEHVLDILKTLVRALRKTGAPGPGYEPYIYADLDTLRFLLSVFPRITKDYREQVFEKDARGPVERYSKTRRKVWRIARKRNADN